MKTHPHGQYIHDNKYMESIETVPNPLKDREVIPNKGLGNKPRFSVHSSELTAHPSLLLIALH